MQSPQYFYEDACAAQWMQDKFGFRFVVLVPHYKDGFGWWTFTPRSMPLDGQDRRYYLHPDRENLLHPQLGDLVTNTHDPRNAASRPCSGIVIGVINDGKSMIISVPERHNGKDYFCEAVAALQVVQRGGVSFHWPKKELPL